MRFLCAVAMVAALCAMSAEKSSAAFVLIDNFYGPGNTGSAAVRGGTVTTNNGVATVTSGQTLTYTNIDPVISPASGLAGSPYTTIRLNGIYADPTANFLILATANGSVNTFEVLTGPVTNGFLDFDFANLDPEDLDTLSFTFTGPGSFTMNGLYAVPEPTTLALIGLAVTSGGVVSFRRRKKAVAAC